MKPTMSLVSGTRKWQLFYLHFRYVAELCHLREETKYLQDHALADNSLKTRRSQWKDYHEFCALYDIVPLPCTEDCVCLYVAYMARKFKYSSIEGYISALSNLQQLHGYVPVNATNFLVKRTMLGAKRKLGYARCRPCRWSRNTCSASMLIWTWMFPSSCAGGQRASLPFGVSSGKPTSLFLHRAFV